MNSKMMKIAQLESWIECRRKIEATGLAAKAYLGALEKLVLKETLVVTLGSQRTETRYKVKVKDVA